MGRERTPLTNMRSSSASPYTLHHPRRHPHCPPCAPGILPHTVLEPGMVVPPSMPCNPPPHPIMSHIQPPACPPERLVHSHRVQTEHGHSSHQRPLLPDRSRRRQRHRACAPGRLANSTVVAADSGIAGVRRVATHSMVAAGSGIARVHRVACKQRGRCCRQRHSACVRRGGSPRIVAGSHGGSP